MEIKTCCTCRQSKSLDNFSKNKASKDGYKEYCKECARIKTKKYRNERRDEINRRNKIWYEETKRNKDARTKKALDQGHKICSCCGEDKNIREFYKRGNGGFYGECKECHNKKVKIYTADNRDKVLERKRKYNVRTKDYHSEYCKEYNRRNSKRNVVRARKWVENNSERAREYSRIYVQKRNAKKRDLPNTLTRDHWKYCKDYFRNEDGVLECAYCGKHMKNATQDHFIPLSKGGGYTADNIIPVCSRCNSRKSDQNFYEWYPSTEFYSQKRVSKIQSYFEFVKAK